MQGILTLDQLRHSAPSIFAEAPWHGMSARYRMVPTAEVLSILRGEGFHPVKAMQSRTRIPEKGDFTRHLIRLRHESHLAAAVGTELPELVLTNSHDGSSAYRFMAGIFRLVCGNGLTVQSADFGSVSVRHSGGDDFQERVIDATYQVVSEAPRTMEKIEAWKQVQLTPPQREAFAAAALELRDNKAVTPPQLLAPRRQQDTGRDLWTTFNVTQENAIKGGLTAMGRDANNRPRRTTTRGVNGIDQDVKLNKALWVLAEQMAALKG